MPNIFRNIILTLIGIGLLWSFQISASSDFYHEKLAIIDVAADEESSEKENCELENWQFLNLSANNFTIPQLSSRLENSDDNTLLEYFSAVPTSPPNA